LAQVFLTDVTVAEGSKRVSGHDSEMPRESGEHSALAGVPQGSCTQVKTPVGCREPPQPAASVRHPDGIHPIHDLDLLRHAPAGHKGCANVISAKQMASASLTTPRALDGVEIQASAPQFASSYPMI